MLDNLKPKQLQENVRTSARNLWLVSLGAVASVEEEGSQFFDQLVSRGRKVEDRRRRQVQETLETAGNEVESLVDKLASDVERQVATSLERAAIPTRSEVRELSERVQRLSRLVDDLGAPHRQAEDNERTIYHVTPHDDGWRVKAVGAERASRVTETKVEAVDVARELAHNQEPSQVVVHRLDGTIQDHFTYGELEESAGSAGDRG